MPKSDLGELVATNRANAMDLSTNVGRRRMREVLVRAQRDLNKRLGQAEGVGGPGKESFTATQIRATLAQVTDVLKSSTKDMRKVILEQGKDASGQATSHLVDYLQAADKSFRGIGENPIAIKEAGMLDRVNSGVESSILNRLSSTGEPIEGADAKPHKAKMGILQRYGVETIGHFEEILQRGVLTKKPWAEMRDEIVQASPFLQGMPAHWAERIVRTETMNAYNRANFEAVNAADEELGDMVKVLSATFDDRTGWDSYQVHGQIRRPTEAFAWADGLYQHPPNRPNDREVVIAHRISWPIPDYLRWRSDGEVMARYRMQRKTGNPGPRPIMTTVALERFGK